MLSAGEVGIELTEMLLPFMSALMLLVITLWFKDFAAGIARGLAFRFSSQFKEGDVVLLDDEQAIIVKIGITQTVFGILRNNGDYCWRYIPNERISSVKLEKVIVSDVSRTAER